MKGQSFPVNLQQFTPIWTINTILKQNIKHPSILGWWLKIFNLQNFKTEISAMFSSRFRV